MITMEEDDGDADDDYGLWMTRIATMTTLTMTMMMNPDLGSIKTHLDTQDYTRLKTCKPDLTRHGHYCCQLCFKHIQ